MKNTNRTRPLEYVTAGKKRYTFHTSFSKKDNIIRNIEISVACVVAFITGIGVYELFQ